MQGEYYNSEEQMFWEGHLIRFGDHEAAKNYAATYGRDVGFCSTCNTWVDRTAHFDRDGACLLTTDRRPLFQRMTLDELLDAMEDGL